MNVSHLSLIHRKTDAGPRFADEDTFESGETYFERLFDTLPLFQEAYRQIRSEPSKRTEILKDYETKIQIHIDAQEE